MEQIDLAGLGNVAPGYAHHWREAEPGVLLVTPAALFKWYHVHQAGIAVPDALDTEARGVLADAVASGNLAVGHGLNFAMLHVSTAVSFLIAGVWAQNQEMWETVWVKERGSERGFVRNASDGWNVPTLCVWELGVVQHERMAWHRYLFTPRADADKRAYLDDLFTGQV